MIHKALITLCTLPLLLSATLNGENDFQVWVTESMRTPLKEKLFADSLLELRFGNNASELYLFYGQFGLTYQPVPWLEWSLIYRQTGFRVGDTNDWGTRYVPITDLITFWPRETWKFSARQRFMYFINDNSSRKNLWLYRPLFQANLPKIGTTQLEPYINEELFFLQSRGFVESRSVVGINYLYLENALASLYYMLRYIKPAEADWRPTHVFGIQGRFSF